MRAVKELVRLQRADATKTSTSVDIPIRTALRSNGLPSASIPNAAPGFSVMNDPKPAGNDRNGVEDVIRMLDVKLRTSGRRRSSAIRQPAAGHAHLDAGGTYNRETPAALRAQDAQTVGKSAIAADIRRVLPAALALFAARAVDADHYPGIGRASASSSTCER